MDVREVAHQFLQRDARHRISLYVEALPKRFSRGTLHESFKDAPEYGFVDSVDKVPLIRSTSSQSARQQWVRWLHYVYDDGVVYLPTMNLSGGDPFDAPVFLIEGASYMMSPRLFEVLCVELSQAEQLFPEIPGMELKTLDYKEKDLKVLVDAGYFVQMAGFTKRGTPLGSSRLVSEGFVSRFGFPGEEPRVVNRLEVSESLILATQENQPSQGDAAVVDADGTQFLRGLKEMCFDIQSTHGPHAAKYAWEVYKRSARFIGSRESRVS